MGETRQFNQCAWGRKERLLGDAFIAKPMRCTKTASQNAAFREGTGGGGWGWTGGGGWVLFRSCLKTTKMTTNLLVDS